MAVTYGFYNSVDGDRRYNAHDIGRLFDGLITDGVYLNVGDCFEVTQAGGMTVNVGVGRAWFHNTWLYNDAPLPITLDPADVLDRIDAIVIEVNTNDDVRRNDIKYIRGTPSSSAERPNLVKADKINQYALVYININGGATGITSNDILSVVGTEETPVVSGIVQPSGLFASKGEFESHLADIAAHWGIKRIEGTYVGNGNANREIVLGFKPELIIITGTINTREGLSFIVKDSYSGILHATTSLVHKYDAITSNGFKLPEYANRANVLNEVYSYIAFKQEEYNDN